MRACARESAASSVRRADRLRLSIARALLSLYLKRTHGDSPRDLFSVARSTACAAARGREVGRRGEAERKTSARVFLRASYAI